MYIPGSYPILAGRPNGLSNNNNSNAGNNNNNMNEEFMTWNDNRNISYPPSPGQQGVPYAPGMPLRSDRSASFDDTVLPPSLSESLQQPHAYSAGPGTGPQVWGYGAPPTDMYGNSSNVSQGRSTVPLPYPGQPGGPQYRHPPQYGGPYGGHFGFPTTSPGPPIQTTNSNKGPDGANLFIFHIPNHFTNLDMYQLFCPYGNLLSVRIMVEKDSGRSRGFGFVSYDNSDAAALAIKELNGFAVRTNIFNRYILEKDCKFLSFSLCFYLAPAMIRFLQIGNKRLKVQHKQIRSVDQHGGGNFNAGGGRGHNSNPHHGGGRGGGSRGTFSGRGGGTNLPPSGPMAISTGWYNNDRNVPSSSSGAEMVPTGEAASGDPHHVVVVVGEDPTTNVTSSTGVSSASGGGEIRNAADEQQLGTDPLSSMEPLRQTLPDIGGVASPAVPGEN